MAQKITCPVCFTKMNSVGHDLVCPSCGYKYCEGRQPYTYDDHNHNQYESYSQKTTYASSAQSNPAYGRPSSAPGTSPITPSAQSQSTVRTESQATLEAKRKSAKKIIVTVIAIYLLLACVPVLFGGIYFILSKNESKSGFAIETEYEEEEEEAILIYAADAKPENFVQDFLRQAFQKELGEITTADCNQITGLELSTVGSDVWVRYYVNVSGEIQERYLFSEFTNIDFSELNLCENLESLTITSDLKVTPNPGDLKTLKKLHTVSCSFAPAYLVEAMDPSVLEALYLSPDEASYDLSGIKEFQNLEILSVTADKVTHADEIGALANLMQLDFHLSSDASDLSFLESLGTLQYLFLAAPDLDTLSFVSGMPNLQWLEVTCAPNLTDISPLENCTHLKALDLSCDDGITDFSPICSLKELQNLYLFGCGIDNVQWISQIKSLRCLWLQNNNLTDLSPLAELPKLEELYCFGNEITNYGNLDLSIIQE